MNQLSWLIYWAGIVNYIGNWLAVFAVVSFIMAVGLTIWTCNSEGDHRPPRGAFIIYPMFIFLLITSCLIPNRDTVLAIAASEMGEKVLATPAAKKVGDALLHWIDEQTKPAVDDRHDR